MKPRLLSHFAIIAIASATTIGVSYSQTVTVDDVSAIPGTLKFASEWNVDGDLEGWTANSQYTLTDPAPAGGLLTGTQGAADNDPTLTRTGLNILSSSDTVVEFRITKDLGDISPIKLFWADDNGGFSAGRSVTIAQPTDYPTDGDPHTVRITFSGEIFRQINAFRLDPSENTDGQGLASSTDYFRVYTTNPALKEWDPTMSGGVTPGGAGTWDTSTANWWNGAQVTWPAVSSGVDDALFGGATAGDVTVSSGLSVAYATFATTGYKLTGNDPLTLDGAAVLKNTGNFTTTLDVPLTGSASNSFLGGSYVFTKAATFTGPTSIASLATSVDNPLGASSNNLFLGNGGNVTLGALGAGTERTIGNNISMTTNRIIINNSDYGTGLPLLPVSLTGDVQLNIVSPGELYLRKDLKMSGVVSGSSTAAAVIYFQASANPGTLTLSNPANTFTGNIRWENNSILEADADGSLGDAGNILQFNAGAGTLKLTSAFDSARNININGGAKAQIDTNGFDSIFSGPLTSSASTAAGQFRKLGAGKLTLTGAGSSLGLGGVRVDGGTLEIGTGAAITSGSGTANGVSAGTTMRINGGAISTGNFAVGLGAGTGTVTLDSGTLTNTLEFIVGWTGDGVFNVNGGLANLNNLSLTNAEPFTSTINLNGGEVRLLFFNARANAATSATATINFNGSLIKGKGDRGDFIETNTTTIITANVQTGGAIIDTNGFTLTIKQPLVHDAALGGTADGGLTKRNAGTLNLDAANTYTGPTTVDGGILQVNGASIADSGKLAINGGKVLVPGVIDETVDTLFLNGVQQPAGVYGSTASTAPGANQNDTYFDVAGTGTITVLNGPVVGNTYASWLAANPPATGFVTDSDNDGVANGVENVLGTDPNAYSAGLTQVSATANSVTFKHTLNPTIASDVSYTYQWSTDLVDWKASGVANTAGTIGTIVASPPAAGVVTVTTTRSGTASGKMFTRIKASNP